MMSPAAPKPSVTYPVDREPVELDDEELLAELAVARGDAVLEMGQAFIADGEGADALTKLAATKPGYFARSTAS
jgi:hypothetical protein